MPGLGNRWPGRRGHQEAEVLRRGVESRAPDEMLGLGRRVPGNPMKSALLRHPLAEAAGGDRFHAGGKHWKSQNDPDWQILAEWVRGKTHGGSK